MFPLAESIFGNVIRKLQMSSKKLFILKPYVLVYIVTKFQDSSFSQWKIQVRGIGAFLPVHPKTSSKKPNPKQADNKAIFYNSISFILPMQYLLRVAKYQYFYLIIHKNFVFHRCYMLCRFVKTATWLPNGQCWAIIEGKASPTEFELLCFY